MSKPGAKVLPQDKEIRELSSVIHLSLYGLSKIFKMTPELESQFCEGMFNKSNPAAFPPVMHFLLYNLDPVEFNSRFLWPLHSDKTAEREFRKRCITYLNDLFKKHELGAEEVGQYIAVVPGGLKFLKVLDVLVKLVQRETLKSHGRFPAVFPPEARPLDDPTMTSLTLEYSRVHNVHRQMSLLVQEEIKRFQKRTEKLKYHTKTLEAHSASLPKEDIDQALQRDVQDICGRMQQVVSLVSDLEKGCKASETDQQTADYVERIRLSKGMYRVEQHHNWSSSCRNEVPLNIDCVSVLELAKRIVREVTHDSAGNSCPEFDFSQLPSLKENMERFLSLTEAAEKELQLTEARIRLSEMRVKEQKTVGEPLQRVSFPERDYKLVDEVDDLDVCHLYSQLHRSSATDKSYRLALHDAIPEVVVLFPQDSSLKRHDSVHESSGFLSKKSLASTTTTNKKKTKALSILNTISRGKSKKSRVNIEALKDLAKNGFNDSNLNMSQLTWKKKGSSVNGSHSSKGPPESVNVGETTAKRFSGLFSDSMMPRFNSTAIFNSTTNEQAHQFVLGDITNKEGTQNTPQGSLLPEGSPLLKQFHDVLRTKDQENILDCSDSVLID